MMELLYTMSCGDFKHPGATIFTTLHVWFVQQHFPAIILLAAFSLLQYLLGGNTYSVPHTRT